MHSGFKALRHPLRLVVFRRLPYLPYPPYDRADDAKRKAASDYS